MFKKMIIMVMVAIVALSAVACTSVDAASITPETVPGIVGYEHIDRFVDTLTRFNSGEDVYDYTVEMLECDGFWYVGLAGETEAYRDQAAVGIYDHAPTEEEINFLWTNRVSQDVLMNAFEEMAQ